MTRAGALALVLGTILVPGCASTPHNYLDPQAPLFDGSYGITPSPGPELRVVTFNVEFGLRVDQAIEALQSHPGLRGPDVLLLQEMDHPGVDTVAKTLSLNYAYCPSSVHPGTERDAVGPGERSLAPDGSDGVRSFDRLSTERLPLQGRRGVATSEPRLLGAEVEDTIRVSIVVDVL